MIDHIKQSRHPQDGTKSAFEFVHGTSGGPFSYRVAAHIGDDTILDWDKKIKDHHPDTHQSFLDVKNELDGYTPFDDQAWDHAGFMQEHGDQTGQQFYRFLTKEQASDAEASKLLLGNGIHGIRYKDEGSRNLVATLSYNGQPLSFKPLDKAKGKHERVGHYFETMGRTSTDFQDFIDKLDEFGTKFLKSNELANWAVAEHRAGRLVYDKPKPTYNYVVFHPDFLEALAQYNIKGEKTKDYGPGVHLKAVEHDPFEGEDR
jgi:hypothetical protein